MGSWAFEITLFWLCLTEHESIPPSLLLRWYACLFIIIIVIIINISYYYKWLMINCSSDYYFHYYYYYLVILLLLLVFFGVFSIVHVSILFSAWQSTPLACYKPMWVLNGVPIIALMQLLTYLFDLFRFYTITTTLTVSNAHKKPQAKRTLVC